MGIAALVEAQRWRFPHALPAQQGASQVGAPFVPQLPNAYLSVEVAWNANLADPTGDTYSWTPITADVRTSPGLSWRFGRNDESSQSNPAELTLLLDNTSGDYGIGGGSRWFPYVRRNTPVRVRIDPDGTGARTVFQGGATGWTPSWDNPDIPVVELSVSGSLRRLSQGDEPSISSIRRYLTVEPDVVSYWPCEEGVGSTFFPPVRGTARMTWSGFASLASNTSFPASRPIPTMNGVAGVGGVFTALVDTYTPQADNGFSVRMLMAFPAAGSAPADNTPLFRVFFVGGSLGYAEIRYRNPPAGGLDVLFFDSFGVFISSLGPTAFAINDTARLVSFEMFQSGGNAFYGINTLQLGETTYRSSPGSPFVVATIGRVSQVVINPSAVINGVGFGHVHVMRTRSIGLSPDPLIDTFKQLNGYLGEVATARVSRLGRDNNTVVRIYDGVVDEATPSDLMGGQITNTLLALIRECETLSRGILWDGLGPGLALTSRRALENAQPIMTLNSDDGELLPVFQPEDDDQRTRNRVTVQRNGGGTAIAEDTTGPLGTAIIGVYSDSVTINSSTDAAAPSIAQWLVHVGTIEGYRYPKITLDIGKKPRLAALIVDLFIGATISVTNLADALSTHAPETVALIVEGVSTRIGGGRWVVELTCSRASAWLIGIVSAPTGETSDYANRAIDDGVSTVNTTAPIGATSLIVRTASGPLWTTVADDYPLFLNVGGRRIRATACAGASSPQTFTIDALSAPLLDGKAVTVWDAPVLGL